MIGGRYVGESPALAPHFTYGANALAWMIVVYGVCRLGDSGVAAAGASRRAEHVREAGNDSGAGRGDPRGAARCC